MSDRPTDVNHYVEKMNTATLVQLLNVTALMAIMLSIGFKVRFQEVVASARRIRLVVASLTDSLAVCRLLSDCWPRKSCVPAVSFFCSLKITGRGWTGDRQEDRRAGFRQCFAQRFSRRKSFHGRKVRRARASVSQSARQSFAQRPLFHEFLLV
jgi:hypothetical protein